MTADELRPLLGFHTTIGEMKRIRATLANLPDDVVFFALFPLATTMSPVNADPLAATLLVDLDPACPLTCEEAVRATASNLWQVSNGLVPFYLLNQFGRKSLRRAGLVVHAEQTEQEPRHRATVILAYEGKIFWETFRQLSFGTSSGLREPINADDDRPWVRS